MIASACLVLAAHDSSTCDPEPVDPRVEAVAAEFAT